MGGERGVGFAMAEGDFAHRTHVLYFRDALLEQLPSPYESNDVNRVTVAYFALSALDLLNALDQVRAGLVG
jgi:geranylgeranyl transferase type-1 subunit beta